jgi:anti-sigma regulatory factor (Ser/Thr protein kinase)/CheY-like chemotaxis protein
MRRILVIGETNEAAGLISSKLPADRYEISTCAGDVEAIGLVRRRAFDVVVTDPTTHIREDLALDAELHRFRPGIRVVVLSPGAAPEEVIGALRAQVFACFSPPYVPDDLVEMVKAAADSDDWQHGIVVVAALPNWITLRVSSRLMTAERLVRFMTEFRADVPEDDRFLLMTAFREMLINCMEHGAGFDPEKTVEVTAARTGRAIVYHFRDPGAGFDRATVSHTAPSTEPDDVLASVERRAELGLRPGGFGSLIVRQIVDELVYNEHGNEVILIKYTS